LAPFVGHAMLSKSLFRPLARVVVPDRALAAVALADLGGLLGDVVHAHRRRPCVHQIDHYLVALPMGDALSPAVAAATHRIVERSVCDAADTCQFHASWNDAALHQLEGKRL